MRAWTLLAAMMAGSPLPVAACGAGGTVRDWGLHLAWTVDRDCAHPERPAVLVAIPWTAERIGERSLRSPEKAVPQPAPAVRCGMRVTLLGEGENAAIHLAGTALGTARVGEDVAVRIAVSGVVRRGVVRGPGRVELGSAAGSRKGGK